MLEERGLAELSARRVAADWAAHYPLVSRSGPRRVARSLEGLGLEAEPALEAASIMLALELQVKGGPGAVPRPGGHGAHRHQNHGRSGPARRSVRAAALLHEPEEHEDGQRYGEENDQGP